MAVRSNEGAVHFLLALRINDRVQLLKAVEILANDPMQKGNFSGKDDVGRIIQTKMVGSFFISYWPDESIKELRIIEIERI